MRITIAGNQFVFPPSCACCARKADTELPLGVKLANNDHDSEDHQAVPYCEQCARHVKASQVALLILKIVGGAVLVLGLVLGFAVAPLLGVLISLVGLMTAVILSQALAGRSRKMCSPKCVGASPAVKYIGGNTNTHRLDVASPEYAFVFMVANQRNLGELGPEAKALLEARGSTARGKGR